MKKFQVGFQLDLRSPFIESYRILQTNLQFLIGNDNIKTFLVTSAGPGEGKSTTVANLGAVMAQRGARVIIVDYDLRKAEQQLLFNLPNGEGLINVLAGDSAVNQVIKDTMIPNLKVLTTGFLTSNPDELLSAESARRVLVKLSQVADIVLIDSPPVIMVSDATILSSVVDGVIIVIKSGVTKVDAIKQTIQRLENANAKIIGTVLNGVENSEIYYNYKNYYDYYGRAVRKEQIL